MRKMYIGIVGLLAVLGFASAASADDYGMAGCGLGSVLLGSEPGIGQTFAATTNGTSFTQTFGITSGTSNCNDSSGNASTRRFIEGNREALAKDMARGSGETIAALSTLAGCESPKAVGATLQSSFKTILPDASASDATVSRRVVDALRTDGSLACEALS